MAMEANGGFQAGSDLIFSQGLKGKKECGEKKGKEKKSKKKEKKLERGEAVNQDP